MTARHLVREPSSILNGVSRLFSFPNPVNEVAAARRRRCGRAGPGHSDLAEPWLLWLLGDGFLVRVVSGPRFAVGLLATRVRAPDSVAAEAGPRSTEAVRPGYRLDLSVAAIAADFLVPSGPVGCWWA